MLQPALRRLVTRLPLPLSRRRMLSENFLTSAKFSAAMPTRLRCRSSPKDMSSTQCSEFSTPQWPRMYRMKSALLSRLLMYQRVSTVSSLETAFHLTAVIFTMDCSPFHSWFWRIHSVGSYTLQERVSTRPWPLSTSSDSDTGAASLSISSASCSSVPWLPLRASM